MFGCFDPPSLTGSTPKDDFVFFQPPSLACANVCCGNGWLTAVSARNSLTLFGATLGIGPDVGPSYPGSWEATSDVGWDCSEAVGKPSARGFDLSSAPATPPQPLDAGSLAQALDRVWHTPVPLGLSQRQGLFDAVALRYQYSTGPSGIQWLVLLNSGWLE